MKVSLSTALSGAWHDALINLKIPDNQIFTKKNIQIYSNLATQFLNITSLYHPNHA